MADDPTVRTRPLVVVWSILALVGGLSLARSQATIEEPSVLLAIGGAWGALVFAGVRTQALLQAALSKSGALVDAGSPVRHRIAPLLPVAIVVGALAGSFYGGALVGANQLLSPRWALIVVCPVLTPPLVLAALRLFSSDLNVRRSPRTTTIPRWVLLDTALPAAFICAPFSAGFAWLRLRPPASANAEVLIDAVSISRHFALTFVIWGLCVGTAAFMKVRRERVSALVDAPIATAVAPSPAALGGILAICLLVIGPRVLDAHTLHEVVVAKGVLGFVLGGLISAFGALRGARDPSETIRPR